MSNTDLYEIMRWADAGSNPEDPAAPTLETIEHLETAGLVTLECYEDEYRKRVFTPCPGRWPWQKHYGHYNTIIKGEDSTHLRFTYRGRYEATRRAAVAGIDVCTGQLKIGGEA